jgi:hypothetical protein
MTEIVVGIILSVAGIVGVAYRDVFAFLILIGIGLIWNGVGIREREKNKPPKDRPYLNAP